MAQGKDPENLTQTVADPKTMGHGKVMPPSTRDVEVIKVYLLHMSEKLGHRLRTNGLEAQRFGVSLLTEGGWLSSKYSTAYPSDDGRAIYALCEACIDQCWRGEGVHQVHVVALDPMPKALQGDLFAAMDTTQEITHSKRQRVNQVQDAINHRYGEFTLSDAQLLHRSKMPNVIAPAWKPDGHRNTLRH